MKEYLFFQNHKKFLKDHRSGMKRETRASDMSIATANSTMSHYSQMQTTMDFKKLFY